MILYGQRQFQKSFLQNTLRTRTHRNFHEFKDLILIISAHQTITPCRGRRSFQANKSSTTRSARTRIVTTLESANGSLITPSNLTASTLSIIYLRNDCWPYCSPFARDEKRSKVTVRSEVDKLRCFSLLCHAEAHPVSNSFRRRMTGHCHNYGTLSQTQHRVSVRLVSDLKRV